MHMQLTFGFWMSNVTGIDVNIISVNIMREVVAYHVKVL